MTHTPGPWFVADWQNDFGDDLFTVEAREKEILGEGQSSIWPDGIRKIKVASTEDSEFDREVSLANARLIASAPEMLMALKAVVDDNVSFARSVGLVEKAIAKAEGR